MSAPARVALVAVLVATACDDGEKEGGPAAPRSGGAYRPVLAERLAEQEGRGLPATDEEEVRKVRELLEAEAAGGRLGRMAARDLDQQEPVALTATLLAVVEERVPSNLVVLRRAYARLARTGVAAALPRMLLRLKYEKDWEANVDLARALLRWENGAGLDAVVNILGAEDLEQESVQRARVAAAAFLEELPAADGSGPPADFEAGWERLLELRDRWTRERRLGPATPDLGAPLDEAVRAEAWRMIARFTSQPLRPVDDARFVLTRMDTRVVPLLCEAAEDESLYVREHALQTLAWMGGCTGHFVRATGFDLLARLEEALGDARQRPRVLEALGATGLTAAADLVLPWLEAGKPDERTAAADALLRCAGPGALGPVHLALEGGRPLSPEARYSLALLAAELDPATPPAEAPPELDPAERERRDHWTALRADREE